jgi:hypothetical protein
VTVTRTELAHHVHTAFAGGLTTRDQLLAHATASHARPEILSILHRLPDKTYATVRDLWYHLDDIPVGS